MYLILGDELLERLGSEWLGSSVLGLPVGQARSPVLVLAWVGKGPGWGRGDGWVGDGVAGPAGGVGPSPMGLSPRWALSAAGCPRSGVLE